MPTATVAASRAFAAAPSPAVGHALVSSARVAVATTTRIGARRAAAAVVVLSHRRDGGEQGGGRLVDEDMDTLRRRIREAREAAEEEEDEYDDDCCGGGLPVEERRRQGSYVAGDLLQAFLHMSARPVLAAGLMAMLLLLAVSVQLLRAVDAVASALLLLGS
uniref:Uncharacterized protein n=1 Tax=Leersia perrieri TaxID=77586 RepID=A0A0D9WIP1_9ORYZ